MDMTFGYCDLFIRKSKKKPTQEPKAPSKRAIEKAEALFQGAAWELELENADSVEGMTYLEVKVKGYVGKYRPHPGFKPRGKDEERYYCLETIVFPNGYLHRVI